MELNNKYSPLIKGSSLFAFELEKNSLILNRRTRREQYVQDLLYRLNYIPQVVPLEINKSKRSRFDHVFNMISIVNYMKNNDFLDVNSNLDTKLRKGVIYHDLGHPPFGHAGEREIDELLNLKKIRFSNSDQSVRILKHQSETKDSLVGIFNTEPLDELYFDETSEFETCRVIDFLDDLENCIGDLIDLWNVFKSRFVFSLYDEIAPFGFGIESKTIDVCIALIKQRVIETDEKQFLNEIIEEKCCLHNKLKDIRKQVSAYIKGNPVISEFDHKGAQVVNMLFYRIAEELQFDMDNPKDLRFLADITASCTIKYI